MSRVGPRSTDVLRKRERDLKDRIEVDPEHVFGFLVRSLGLICPISLVSAVCLLVVFDSLPLTMATKTMVKPKTILCAASTCTRQTASDV